MIKTQQWRYCLTIFLVIGTCVSSAPPLRNSTVTSRELAKRALPQFINFGTSSDDTTRLARTKQAFQDMTTMVYKCLGLDQNNPSAAPDNYAEDMFNHVHGNYFPSTTQARQTVRDFLTAMVDPGNGDQYGSGTLSQIPVNDEDHDLGDGKSFCNELKLVAYTENSRPADRENEAIPLNMHFCHTDTNNAYNLPDLRGLSCQSIGNTLGTQMQTLGGYALVHELTHVNEVAASVIPPLGIPNAPYGGSYTNTIDFEYGPQKVQQLLYSNNPQRTLINADSYAWFVTELYWAIECHRNFNSPASNLNVPSNVCPSTCIPR